MKKIETMTEQIKRKQLDATSKSDLIEYLEEELKNNIIGQYESCESIANSLSRVLAGIGNKERPILNLLFLGSTGVGKTESVKVLSKILFGERDAFTRVNCEELTSEHSFAKIIGCPPGYVGNDIEPMLSQNNVDSHFEAAHKYKMGLFSSDNLLSQRYSGENSHGPLSIILFDEIEKAHPKIWSALIGIMDDGHLTLGNNEIVNLKNSIIIMTSNVGARDLDKTLQKASVGFDIGGTKKEDDEVEYNAMKASAIEAAKEHFPPEFCNRFDRIITFKTLNRDEFSKILLISLQNFCQDLTEAKVPLFINYKQEFLDMLLEKGIDKRYGARNLNRIVQDELITPISKMINTKQLIANDAIEIEYSNGKSIFTREARYTKDLLTKTRKKMAVKKTTIKKK